MSAAAIRRKKQLAAKAASGGQDPITAKMNSLLSSSTISEDTAYEALQLAQSQVRKSVIHGEYTKAVDTYGYQVLVQLLQKGKASVASQLMTLLVQVLNETHTVCNEEWIAKIQTLSQLNIKAIQGLLEDKNDVEYKRLMKLHAKFLKSVLGWSTSLGNIRYGSLEIHKLLADQLWEMSLSQAENSTTSTTTTSPSSSSSSSGVNGDDGNGAGGDDDYSKIGLQSEAMTHYALAEDVPSILSKLATLPNPTNDETAQNHTCPPCTRENLLTRTILLLLSIENIRDAIQIMTGYLANIEKRDLDELKTSYMSKTDGKAPPHPIFCSMIIEICRKNVKTGPLFTWATKSFNAEMSKMYKPEVLKVYLNSIGKIYFHIVPPPSMMETIENMMSMMGGGGAGGMGGMNPAMMQAMMNGMGGAGM